MIQSSGLFFQIFKKDSPYPLPSLTWTCCLAWPKRNNQNDYLDGAPRCSGLSHTTLWLYVLPLVKACTYREDKQYFINMGVVEIEIIGLQAIKKWWVGIKDLVRSDEIIYTASFIVVNDNLFFYKSLNVFT